MSEIISITAPVTAVRNIEVSPKLALIKDLFDALHEEKINYCHWKSNEHLNASMTADTDLDVLFDERQKDRVLQLFAKLGFKRFDSIKQKQYKDIIDYIGLDLPSGRIIHLHTHFRLTMGEAYLKGYQLKLEDKILSTRVFDEDFGIYRTHPAFELILLYFRESLKIRNRDIYQMRMHGKVNYTGNIMREYNWLKQRCTNSQIEAILKTIFKDYRPVYELVTGEFNRPQLIKLSSLVKKEFKNNRLFSPIQALLLRWYREMSVTAFRKLAKRLNRPIISQRINPRSGLVIAIIGADGSGKSTVIGNLQSTFKKKLDVYKIYMGKGKMDAASWPRKLLLRFKKKPAEGQVQKTQVKASDASVQSTGTPVKKRSQKENFFRCLEALIVALEKRTKLKQMQDARKRGMLVICDRFPQNQVIGYNDGPVLNHLITSSNPIYRAIAKMETRVCTYAENHPPDVVFKLVADAKIIEARKPSKASLDMLEAKIEGIKRIRFAESCQVITVDATQSLDKVLYAVKKGIWEAYK